MALQIFAQLYTPGEQLQGMEELLVQNSSSTNNSSIEFRMQDPNAVYHHHQYANLMLV